MPFEFFPNTNFHDLNLDYILQHISDVEKSRDAAKASEEAAAASEAAAAGSAADAASSAGAAEISAEEAADSAEEARDYADHIADPVAGLVTGWLDEHVDPATGYVINDTLTVRNAAADAKAAGDWLRFVGDNLASLMGPGAVYDWSRVANTTYPTGWRVGYWSSSNGGLVTTGNNWICLRSRYSAFFRGYDFFVVTPPAGYRVWVTEYTADATSTFVRTWGANDEHYNGMPVRVPVTEGNYYAFTVGRFDNDDADTYLTDDFVSQIVLARYYSLSRTEKESTDKKSSQIHFNVEINATDLGDNTADTDTPLTVNAVVMLPSTYHAYGKPTKAVFIHHGQSGTVTDTEWYPQVSQTTWRALLNSYLNAGYAVFDVNGCGPADGTSRYHRDYGCFAGIQAAYKAYQYLIATYNIDTNIFVHGGSMGGATAIAFAKAYPNIVTAMVLFSPAELARSAMTTSYRADIAMNYGYADIAAMEADGYRRLIPSMPAVDHYDTDGNLVRLPVTADWSTGSAYADLYNVCKLPCPVKAWHGADDDVTRPSFTRALITAAYNAGVQAYYTEVPGIGHDLSTGASATANAEAVLWLSRFN